MSSMCMKFYQLLHSPWQPLGGGGGGGAETVRDMVVVWVSEPLDPVTVKE